MREHAVDDDFAFRLGYQMAAKDRKRAAAGNSRWNVPMASISHRRKLRSARETHLYALETDSFSYVSLALHPNGKTLLCSGYDPTSLSLWDIPSKQRIRSFGHGHYVKDCGFAAGRAVSFTWTDGLRIWNMDGTCVHSLHVRGSNALITGQEVFVIDPYANDPLISVIDIHTGEISRTVSCNARRLSPLGNDRLLAFFGSHVPGGKLRVLDQKSLQELSRVEGFYRRVDTNDQGQVVASTNTNRVDVFNLEGDDLVLRNSFYVPDCSSDSVGLWKLHQSHIYVSCDRPTDYEPFGFIRAYNLDTGRLERQLMYPSRAFGNTYFPTCMVATENELLVGFNWGGYHPSNLSGYTIEAYAM